MDISDLKELPPLPSVNAREVEWEVTRFGTTSAKTLSLRDGVFFGIAAFEPGGHTFAHRHGFRQLRYVLKGEFIVNRERYGPGDLIDFPELTEYEVFSPSGGEWIVVQTPGAGGEAPQSGTGIQYTSPSYRPGEA